jgi:chemosensory pili system protein ChpA (sensor histidine kinase/response regulator)
LTHDFGEWRHELNRRVSEAAVRAAHSLSGTSATIGLAAVHDLAYAVESVLQVLHRTPATIGLEEIALLQDGVEGLRAMLHRFAAEAMPEPDVARVARLFALRDEIKARQWPVDPHTVTHIGEGSEPPVPATTSEPSSERLHEPDVEAAGLAARPAALEEQSEDFIRTEIEAQPVIPNHPGAHQAELAARPAGEGDDRPSSGSHDATASPQGGESLGDAILSTDLPAPVTEPAAEVGSHADWEAELPEFKDEFGAPEAAEPHAASGPAVAEPTLDESEPTRAVPDLAPAEPEPTSAEPEPTPVVPEAAALARPAVPFSREQSPAVQVLKAAAAQASATALAIEAVSHVRDEIDPELIEIFLQEASEYLPQIGVSLRQWQQAPHELEHPQALMRQMHTIKGSARMAGAMRLGELVHNMETRVEWTVNLRDIPPGAFEDLIAAHDRALELYDALVHPKPEVQPERRAIRRLAELEEPEAGPAEIEGLARPQPVVGTAQAFAAHRPQPVAGQPTPATQVVQAVRVRADVLDRLVNQAGEVSISRSRLENEVGQIRSSLSDLTENLGRLRGQLREIEIQAETQMQSQLSLAKERERFDPLEFDRFTRLQELTRMMAESVNDVATVHQNLLRSLDGANRDLMSQQRMTRDLQQDLMRVRMVPFSSISERLYRLVRQTAKELDKRVNLDIRGGGVEIDRSVLERMVAPFEHILRNAIVHGIEPRAVRIEKGKAETGELLVEVRQEGNEIVLVFSDDGAGLNLDRIREKGRQAGLINPDEEIPDARASDLIFQPGFTTVSEVTELAGRGVGMDVVRAEAGGLGGRVSVDSESTKGTRFTINLPLTLAVTQVVLVNVAGRVYALPSVLVEQVQQLRPQPLAQAYNEGQITWLGQPVRLHFLAGLLGERDRSPLAQRYSPVLILRSGGERIAVHVDEVIGNQEVVVKNIGPQLARMIGIAGATVLGSGDIVLILNPVQLAQQALRERTALAGVTDPEIGGAVAELIDVPARAEPVAGLETLPIVMVVDDSLTVRRVTQRLLMREGYQVVLAKDGVDALQQLQDYTPDVMLVDIEMPRMDGFDLTRNIRGDERYRGIPIIMITSRTADKHRSFALELGVNVYLGKPYQEAELLDHLSRFVVYPKRATA